MMVKAVRFLGAVLALSVAMASAQETTAPNVLLITGDDLGAYLGCYGDTIATTPHMDSIAKAGVRFDNAWVTQASCSPSRSSILTGLYPHQNGQIGLAHLGFSMSRAWPSIPSILNGAGYYTCLIGKLHVKPEEAFPFQFRWDGKGAKNRHPKRISEQVKNFVSQAGAKPFFLHASFYDPHRPFMKDVDGSPVAKVDTSAVKLLPFMEGLDEVPGLKDEVSAYYTCINRMDECVGEVLSQLDKAGKLQNTLIILIGDHGAPFGRGKVTCFNPGMRIPFIVKWPAVAKPGTSSAALVSTIDIMPTILDAAGIKPEPGLPGLPLRKVLSDPGQNLREFMCGEFTAHLPIDYYPRRTIRTQRYQLIHNLKGGQKNPTPGIEGKAERDAVANTDVGTSRARTAIQTYVNPPEFELYDLDKDPENFENLAAKPEHKQTIEELKAHLMQWRQETSDPLLKQGELERVAQDIETRLDTRYIGLDNMKKDGDKKPADE